MASRVALFAALVLGALGSAGVDARTPVAGTAMFVVHDDARACPGPRCGGYLVALANGARTRCVDGSSRTRCRAALALDRHGERLGRLPGGSLVRAVLPAGRDDLGELRVHALYLPTGTAPASGGFYRVLDNGIRCVRAPCFSLTARSVNASTRITVSSIDVRSARASRVDIRRAEAALRTKSGLYARGRFARQPDGGRLFRALRLYLRAPLPPA